jgi:dihydrofolate reductase
MHRRPGWFKERHVRRLVATEFLSVDALMNSPGEWQEPYFDENLGNEMAGIMAGADAMLLGRVTYEEFASFWSRRSLEDDPGADFMNNTPKYVVSTTLNAVDWSNSTLIKGDLADEVGKLKRQDGKDLLLMGSGGLLRSLLAMGLVDELRLQIHPIILGRGKPLFDASNAMSPLALTDSKVFGRGVLALTYRPAQSAGA